MAGSTSSVQRNATLSSKQPLLLHSRLLLHSLIGVAIVLSFYSAEDDVKQQDVAQRTLRRDQVEAERHTARRPASVHAGNSPSKWKGSGVCTVSMAAMSGSCNPVEVATYNKATAMSRDQMLLHQHELEQVLFFTRNDGQVQDHMKHSSAVYDWFMVRIRIFKQLTGCTQVHSEVQRSRRLHKGADTGPSCSVVEDERFDVKFDGPKELPTQRTHPPMHKGSKKVIKDGIDHDMLKDLGDFLMNEGIMSFHVDLP